jgi:hypothetical protein
MTTTSLNGMVAENSSFPTLSISVDQTQSNGNSPDSFTPPAYPNGDMNEPKVDPKAEPKSPALD